MTAAGSTVHVIPTIDVHTSPSLAPDDARVARGVFTVREAAGYLGMSVSTLSDWASARRTPQVVTTAVGGGRPGGARVPFIGFAEAFVLSAFRQAGVPLQRIRPAVNCLKEELGVEHALASQNLYTDGTEVLFNFLEETRSDQLELTVVRTGQKQFSEVVRTCLKRISYGKDGWASQIELPTYRNARVVVDANRAFGLPMIVSGGARVEDIVHRFVAGDCLIDIARDFAVPSEEVEDVIRVATQASTAAA